MYCSNCGVPASGNFCSQCGHKVQKPQTPLLREQPDPHAPIFDFDPPSIAADDHSADDWAGEVNYKKLIRHPDVRDLLVMAGNRARAGVTGEQLLEKFDSVVPGIAIAAAVVQPLYSQWGVNTGKTAAQQFDLPVGKVLVALLCALAEGSSKIRNVQQLPDGCRIEASIPSDIWSFEGILTVQIQRQGAQTSVEAATKIPGQFFDFGKSQRFLNQLLGSIRTAA